jgi:hypothetical protein
MSGRQRVALAAQRRCSSDATGKRYGKRYMEEKVAEGSGKVVVFLRGVGGGGGGETAAAVKHAPRGQWWA